MDASALLRPGLLDGCAIALGGGSGAGPALADLGATVAVLPVTLDEELAAEHARAAISAHGALAVLLQDMRPGFAPGGSDGFRRALDSAWVTVRAVANAAWIEPERPGKLVLIAPPPAPAAVDDPHADGVRDAAENMARTLSIEWSRFGIRTVAITPGRHTADGELTALAAYLASPAGDYFSGARLSLGEAEPVSASPSPR
ncbi:MAG TPA: hypothetical protein VGM91_24015 [Conexibacter sp.]|jgi:NAD(P)-dependent dehydrogenase (short-subunit alcohol dehydrogenase family)